MLPSTSAREAVLACSQSFPWNLLSFTVTSTLFLRARALIPPSLAKVRLSPTLTPSLHHLVWTLDILTLWTHGSVPFPLGKGGSGVFANCSICGTEATLSFSAGPVCSSFSAEDCAILHTLCWSRHHQQVCHFSSLLLLSDSRSVLTTLSSPPPFPFLSNSVADLAGTVFSLLFY